jgi:anti-sigma regulatory factor (Ser/Thr protein kinase)
VREARLFVIDKLQEWHCEDLVDSAALVTSELATNAVVHTGQPYSVQVERNTGGVRVEVTDHGHKLPRMREFVDIRDRDGGDDDLLSSDSDRLFSGLRIVDSVATEWGTLVLPGNGKVVWFELLDDPSSRPRERVADLRDLRDLDAPARGNGSPAVGILDDGQNGGSGQARHMARTDRLLPEYPSDGRSMGRWMVVIALVLLVAVGGFLLFR